MGAIACGEAKKLRTPRASQGFFEGKFSLTWHSVVHFVFYIISIKSTNIGNVGKSQSPCWWSHLLGGISSASVVKKQVNNDLTNVRKPSAVVLSRIQRLRDMDFVNSVEEYLHRNNIDEVCLGARFGDDLMVHGPVKCSGSSILV